MLLAIFAAVSANAQSEPMNAPKFNAATCVDDICGWYYWTSKRTTQLPESGQAADVENPTTHTARIAITKVDETTVKIYGMFEMPVTGTINFSSPSNKYIDIPVNQIVGYSKVNGDIKLSQTTWANNAWTSYTTVRLYIYNSDTVGRIYIYNNWFYTVEPNSTEYTYGIPGINNNYLVAAQNSGSTLYADWNAVMYTTYGKKNKHNWTYETRCVNVTQNGNTVTVQNFLGNNVDVNIDLHADNTITIAKEQNAASGSMLYPAIINDDTGVASADTENDIIGEGAPDKVNWGNFCRSYSSGYYFFSNSEIVFLNKDENQFHFPVGLTVTDAGWASFSSEKNVDFTQVAELTPYAVTSFEDVAELEPITTAIPANNGVFVKGEAGTYEIPTVAEADELSGTNLLGATSNQEVVGDESTIYALGLKDGKAGLMLVTAGTTVAANKAYLEKAGGGAKNFVPFADGETTAIETLDNVQSANSAAYNLQGQRVGNDYKGIVVKNGKKLVVR